MDGSPSQHASVASFNTSSCFPGLHSCPIKPSSSYLCIIRLSVCLELVKIYFNQMLSALLTSAHLSHCSSAHLIRFAWLNIESTRSYPQLCVVISIHRRLLPTAAPTPNVFFFYMHCLFLLLSKRLFHMSIQPEQFCIVYASQAFICVMTKHGITPYVTPYITPCCN